MKNANKLVMAIIAAALFATALAIASCNTGASGEDEPNLVISLATSNARFSYPPEAADLAQMKASLVLTKAGASSGTTHTFDGNKALSLRVDPGTYTIELSLFYKGGYDVPLAKTEAPESVTVKANEVTKHTVKVVKQFDVKAVTVSPSAITVPPGGSRQFSAAMTIDEGELPAMTGGVTWAVSGGASDSTAISASGLLTVGADESVTSLTVTAKFATGTQQTIAAVTVDTPSPAALPDNAKVTVDGNYWRGQTLTAKTSGFPNGTLTYQWKSNGTNLAGQTGETYPISTSMSEGAVISVEVRHPDYTGVLAAALPWTVVANPPLPAGAKVAITGKAELGETLTAVPDFPADAGTINFQWKRNGVDIYYGANPYTLTTDDLAEKGAEITVTASCTGYSGSRTAAAGPVGRATTFTVYNEATWNAARNRINLSSDATANNRIAFTINVTDSFSIDGLVGYGFSRPYHDITINGAGRTISLDDGTESGTPAKTGSLLYIPANQTITMNNLTLKGHESNNTVLVYIYGEFTMNSGAITRNKSSSSRSGGVDVSGTFTMNGGEVSGNTGDSGGGLYVIGTFTMNGGAVSDNSAYSGGGMYVGGGTFTMNGGAISGNTANSQGGGVIVITSTFTMTGGTISGNSATNFGGGVHLGSSTSIFRIVTGTVYGSDAAAGLANTANNDAALSNSGTAEYGTFDDPADPTSAWTPTADADNGVLDTRDTTIRVVNGVLQ